MSYLTEPGVDILIPTYQRHAALASTLGCLLGQTRPFRLYVSDQSQPSYLDKPTIRSALHVHDSVGHPVLTFRHCPPRNIAEHRDFLLRQARSPYVLFLDDDILLEPWVLDALVRVIDQERCGFVGMFPSALSYDDDARPDQQPYEAWDGPVTPEFVEPGSSAWQRAELHRAANTWHVSRELRRSGRLVRYKVAWIAQCCLYDRSKLLSVGGFSWWDRLPRYASGEDVLAQLLLLGRYGGCGVLPSGAYAQEVPTTVLNPSGSVDGHALELLPEMRARFG